MFTQGVYKNGLIKVVHTRLAVDPTKAFELPSDSELSGSFQVIPKYKRPKGKLSYVKSFFQKSFVFDSSSEPFKVFQNLPESSTVFLSPHIQRSRARP